MPRRQNLPHLPPSQEKFCIKCQHCLAICPPGALKFNNITPEMCPQPRQLPSPDAMLNLIQMRRSVRRYKNERIPQEVFARNGMSIYLSGGTSLMRGLDALTKYIFYNVPVHQPAPMQPGQNHSYLADPRYCTAIGLIRFAQRYDDDAYTLGGRSWWSRFLRSLGIGR